MHTLSNTYPHTQTSPSLVLVTTVVCVLCADLFASVTVATAAVPPPPPPPPAPPVVVRVRPPATAATTNAADRRVRRRIVNGPFVWAPDGFEQEKFTLPEAKAPEEAEAHPPIFVHGMRVRRMSIHAEHASVTLPGDEDEE